MPEGDAAGIVAFGKGALVERLPAELREIDRIASSPVDSATDIGAALRLASALFPDDAQKRIVLLSDGNDTTGQGQAEAALAAARGIQVETKVDRSWVGAGSPRRAPHDAVDVAPWRGDRGRRGHPLDGRPAGDRPALRERRAGRHRAARSRSRVEQGLVPRRARGGGLRPVPGRRRGRPEHVQPERSSGLEHDRQGRTADPRRVGQRDSRRRARRRPRGRAPGRRHDRRRPGCRRIRSSSPRTTRSCSSTCRGHR